MDYSPPRENTKAHQWTEFKGDTSLPNLFFKSFQAGFTRFSVSHPVVGVALSSGNYSQVPEIPFESEPDMFPNPKRASLGLQLHFVMC